MIEQDKRKAIYLLHEQGISLREISRKLDVSRTTVKAIIREKGKMPNKIRKDKIKIDQQLLENLYAECEGRIQRIHEKLEEEKNIKISYTTLSRRIRELEIGQAKNTRCERMPDIAGEEMQHDTSSYKIQIGDKKVRVIASILYFRYSKVRYLKFYRTFNRFRMKCFLHEALSFWGYSARQCIIDNTNLARLRGTGKDAVITLEMEQFAKQYGFKFVCHEVNHCNRKAGNERSFYTVETNFFPGRKFQSLEDLNKQALRWAVIRMANRPIGKTRLIPISTFKYEKAYLIKVPDFIQAPYCQHERTVDQYGYAAFNGNFYWVPGTKRGNIKILEYSDYLKIYQNRELLISYEVPAEWIKNRQFIPKGFPKPKYKPKYRKKVTEQEEKKLRAISKEINDYLDFVFKRIKGKTRHIFIRDLFRLSQKIAVSLFIEAIKRAFKYSITDIKTIERIIILKMNDGLYEIPQVEIDKELQNRESYMDGRFSDIPDLSIYDKMLKEEEENG